MSRPLTLGTLKTEAASFAKFESKHAEPALYGVTDGKAIGTYLEQKFQTTLQSDYAFGRGNSALGIDFPELKVDVKVTSIRQLQSSCPFQSARQKIHGLGYSLLVFVFFEERMLPIDTVAGQALADEVMHNPPELGYLTISNALQWRLQYTRVIEKAGKEKGISRIV